MLKRALMLGLAMLCIGLAFKVLLKILLVLFACFLIVGALSP